MRKLRIRCVREDNPGHVLWRCRILHIKLEDGQTIKRGCGGRGLVEFDAGWKCFYCGTYVYRSKLRLESLWFHFKTAREYWRLALINGTEYINGVPVVSPAEHLPHYLLADLAEVRRPTWFDSYMMYEEEEFKQYLKTHFAHGMLSLRGSPPSPAQANRQLDCPRL